MTAVNDLTGEPDDRFVAWLAAVEARPAVNPDDEVRDDAQRGHYEPVRDSTHYDQDELTRDGHLPMLTGGPGGARGSCSCGWWRDGFTMSSTVRLIRLHIFEVDEHRAGRRLDR